MDNITRDVVCTQVCADSALNDLLWFGLRRDNDELIHKTIILPVVLYGCETWSLTLREECWLRVFENRILRRVFELERDENGSGEGSTMRNFIVCTVHLI